MASSPPSSTSETNRRPSSGSWIVLILLAFLILYVISLFSTSKQIRYSDLITLIEQKKVKTITLIGNDRIVGELREPSEETVAELKLYSPRFAVRLPPSQDRQGLIKELQSLDRTIGIDSQEDPTAWVGPALGSILLTLLVFGLVFFIFWPRMRDPMGQGGSFLNNYIKSQARRYEKGEKRVTFDDVADMSSAKAELREIVDFLKSPEKFRRLGAEVPKGVLLVGPPGTGKTLLARAVAGEANVPFFSINGSEFIQMFVGVGASRVRDLFKTAKENAPCLVFIDEIDAVGRMRGAGVGGGSDEREQTLNQILSEMDGFQPNEMVIVIAATNRPDVLDAALLRPGRFDRHVTVDRPSLKGRLAVLKIHTRNKPLSEDVDLEAIARRMIGMTGADLRNLCNEAALLATRQGKTRIDRSDFGAAIDRVVIGPKRDELITPEDRKRTAYHEAGHALVCWLVPNADRPLKVSIIPRGRALGVNLMIPEEERFHYGQSFFKTRLLTLLAGRAADRLVYGEPDAGASDDLRKATRLARDMVTHWGMSERIGPMWFRGGEEHVFLGKEIQEPRDFSEGTAQLIDEEVKRILQEADESAYNLLKSNRDKLDLLANALVEREELDRSEIDQLLGVETGKVESSV